MQKVVALFKKNVYIIMVGIVVWNNLFDIQSVRGADCEWECDNGVCISREYVCDGQVQCPDGSDEIVENCYSNATCPDYAFRCSYGACITGTHKCNGVQECADNSDEMPFLCESNKDRVRELLRGRCGSLEMQCGTGECIDDDLMCDGTRNCRDGTDERISTCSHYSCPDFAFKCAYGACIDGKARCNGIIECHDGSDEASALCGTARRRGTSQGNVPFIPPVTKRPPTRATRPTPKTTTERVAPVQTNYYDLPKCVIPADRDNVIIVNKFTGAPLQAGAAVPVNTVLKFACERGYTRLGVEATLCTNSDWMEDLPICTRFCNETILTHGVSTKVTCFYGNVEVSCTRIRSGTRADISCATGFELDSSGVYNFHKKLICTDSYRWSDPKGRCTMNCGYVQQQSKAYAKNGIIVNITEVPWHVGIYSRLNERAYERICGGSIISSRIVVSAAHCFWDEANFKIYDASFYSVAAGKYFPEYESKDEYFSVQMSSVASIAVSNYEDLTQNYKNDLAILRLHNHFKFTHSISPICVKFLDRAQAAVQTGLEGFIVGWGIPDANAKREVLQKVNVRSQSYHGCRESLSGKGVQYDLPNDKFCVARATTRGDICRGDSGGAFVRRERSGDRWYYRLIGVISHAPLSAQDCGRDGLVALTNLNYFEETIQGYIDGDRDVVLPFT